ncbi:MAG: cyclic-di-AMP receptor [Oscillospiraceae bacterium]|nr:cyclic-di-AMP receptor [Oscillospiraceae bacterium]
MKLLFAIMHDDDSPKVMGELNKNGFYVTKLNSTGGFLKSGNTTLLVGVDEAKLETVLGIIAKKSKSRKQSVSASSSFGGGMGRYLSSQAAGDSLDEVSVSDGLGVSQAPVEVVVGGATIFVIDVEKLIKV